MRITRHKQQRSLLYHHSVNYPHESGCPVTQHCSEMKRLWRHMVGCKDTNCRVPQYFPSRAILSHYRECKDANCPVCIPVRETQRKSRSTSSSRQGPGTSPGPMMESMTEIASSGQPGRLLFDNPSSSLDEVSDLLMPDPNRSEKAKS
jgi:hypothetical protein